MTTYLECVRAAIPDADEACAEYLLWERTPFPFGTVTAKDMFRAASRARRAGGNGISLCMHCNNRVIGDAWECEACDRMLRAGREAA